MGDIEEPVELYFDPEFATICVLYDGRALLAEAMDISLHDRVATCTEHGRLFCSASVELDMVSRAARRAMADVRWPDVRRVAPLLVAMQRAYVPVVVG